MSRCQMVGIGSSANRRALSIDEAEAVLQRASGLGLIGRYQLEAAVQSVHVARRITGRTDWVVIEQLYAALATVAATPVIAINHAIAIGETDGPEAGLTRLGALADDARVAEYQPYWAARADLLARAGHADAAGPAYQRAIGLASDDAVRMFLQLRLDGLAVYR
jgi:RNA polymerase sigma-70 factor (ECF subfamily)